MGIRGLIPFLKPIQKDIHVSEYAGQSVAVDGRGWLYRGAFGCASDLAKGVSTQTYVAYFTNLVKMLIFHKVVPIIVFDGQLLPIKSVTNEARSKLRIEKLAQGNCLYKQGRLADANKSFQQAIDVTPDMVANIIKELDKMNVKHIIAPFEADSQLAFLVSSRQAKAVITEDSDLLVLGVETVIVKMNRYGEAKKVDYKDIFECSSLNMRSFDPDMFRYACILSGCDYLPSLPGIGLKKAQHIVRRQRTIDRIMHSLTVLFSNITVKEYKEKFIKANAAFLYQFIFDPQTHTYARLNSLPKGIKVDHLVGLGESPQNHDVPVLRSNKAIHIDKATIQKNTNQDPFIDLEESEFSELEFNETILKDVELLLDTIEPPVSSRDASTGKRKEIKSVEEILSELLVGTDERAPPDPAEKICISNSETSTPPPPIIKPPIIPPVASKKKKKEPLTPDIVLKRFFLVGEKRRHRRLVKKTWIVTNINSTPPPSSAKKPSSVFQNITPPPSPAEKTYPGFTRITPPPSRLV